MNSPVEVHKRTVFTDVIKKKLGDSLNFPRRRATRTPSIIQVMTLMYHLPMRMMTQGRNMRCLVTILMTMISTSMLRYFFLLTASTWALPRSCPVTKILMV